MTRRRAATPTSSLAWSCVSSRRSTHTVRQICEAPERWRFLEEDVRRCRTRVFPYAVLYTIERDYVLIIAVMHGHRKPGYWRERLEN